MGSILRHVQGRQPKRAKRHHNDTGSAKCALVVRWHPLKSEGIVKQEDLDTGRRTFRKNVTERVGDPTVLAEIQLQRDRLARRPEIVPEPHERAISIESDLNLPRRKEHGPGEHGDAERELRLTRRHRSAIGPDALDMSDGSAARYVLNPNERGERNDERKCPTANPRESGAHMRPDPLDDCRESRGGRFHCGRDGRGA